MSMQRGRPTQYPEIQFTLPNGEAVDVEVTLNLKSVKQWELFALLRDSRRIKQLIQQAAPALESYNLLAQDPAVMELLSLVQQIPAQGQREMENFMRTRRPVRDLFNAAPAPRPRQGFNVP